MKKKRLMLRFLGILLVSLVTTVRAAEFFVAPDGDDANPGSLERPFATPARGLRAARGMKDQPVFGHRFMPGSADFYALKFNLAT